MSESALYELRNVSKRFTRGGQTITIFEGLTMSIPAKDFVAVMGPSGSGKTTLLNLLGGIDAPSEGEITLVGELLYKVSV
jgi:putative ABC transport system ATP-binding protein